MSNDSRSADTVPLMSVGVDIEPESTSSSTTISPQNATNLMQPSTSRPTITINHVNLGHKETSFWAKFERNLYYLKDQLEQLFASRTGPSSSAFVPIVCGTVIFLYFVNLLTKPTISDDNHSAEVDPAFVQNSAILVKWFTVTPGYALSPRHWIWSTISLFTYPFIELYLYQVVVDVIVVALTTTLLEPLWGKKELVQFFIIINLSVAILTMAHYIIIYTVKGDDVYLYGVKIYGLSGYLAALSVTAKQLMPDSVLISIDSIGKLKQDNVPLGGLSLAFFMYLFNLISGMSVITCLYGLLTAWMYLRFFQFHPTNGTRGDLSDPFAFSTFFPNVLQPPINLICNTIYGFLVKIHLCPENTRQYQSVRTSERVTDSFRIPRKNKHKYNPSGDYEHLHQPRVETL